MYSIFIVILNSITWEWFLIFWLCGPLKLYNVLHGPFNLPHGPLADPQTPTIQEVIYGKILNFVKPPLTPRPLPWNPAPVENVCLNWTSFSENPSDLVLSLNNRTDEVEFICAANGSGTVKPKLVWNIDGINADASVVKSWTVSKISIQKLWSQSYKRNSVLKKS